MTSMSPARSPAVGSRTSMLSRHRALWRSRFVRRYLRNPLAVVALAWLLFLLICAVVPSLIALRSPAKQDVFLLRVLEGPGKEFWLGTDTYGRDLFSRVVWGSRPALLAIAIALGIGAGLGVPIGLVSGWVGGRFDRWTMWCADVLFSIPSILFAMAMVGAFGAGLVPAMVAVGILMAARFARLTRGVSMAEKQELYVSAAKITGLSQPTILRRYVLPNVVPVLIVQLAITAAQVLLVAAVLSFLGVGSPPDSYDWGAMLNQARTPMYDSPWQIVPAGLAIVLTVLAFNLVGDGIRDAVGRDHSTNALRAHRARKSDTSATASEITPAVGQEQPLLSARMLSVAFPAADGEISIVSNVTLDVRSGETVAIVGESGSGKTMTALALLGLVPVPGRVSAGRVMFNGQDVTNLSEREWRAIRGKDIGFVFQEPTTTLNPSRTIGAHFVEVLGCHLGMAKRAASQRAVDLLRLVRVAEPERRLHEYPHQLSGGMAQRVALALAICCEPKLLIADEPTTALDVTVQGQVLDLIKEMQTRLGMAMLLVTHDLGVVAEMADSVSVMYAGEIVESARSEVIFGSPQHPYTQALLATIPQSENGASDLPVIPGLVPPPTAWPRGCRFNPRCDLCESICLEDKPAMSLVADDHEVRCFVATRRASSEKVGVR